MSSKRKEQRFMVGREVVIVPRSDHDRLRALFDNLPHALALHRVEPRRQGGPPGCPFLAVNPAFEAMTGLPRDEIVGKDAGEIYGTGGSSSDLRDVCVGALGTGEPKELSYLHEPTDRVYHVTALRDGPDTVSLLFVETCRKEHASGGLSAALGSMGQAVISTDGLGNVTGMNPAAGQLTGWPQAEAIGRPAADVVSLFDPETGEPRPCPVEEALASQRPVVMVGHSVITGSDGVVHHVSVSAAPLPGEPGGPSGGIIVLTDASAEHRALEAARHGEARFLSFAEDAPVSIGRFDRDLRYTYVNPSGRERLSGRVMLPPEDVIGRTDREVWQAVIDRDRRGWTQEHILAVGEAASVLEETLRSVFTTGQPSSVDNRYSTPHGTLHYSHSLAPEGSSDGGVSSVAVLTRNLTELSDARQALRVSEVFYRGLVEDTPLLICTFLPGGEITFANAYCCEGLGTAGEDLVGSGFDTLIAGDIREEVVDRIAGLSRDTPVTSYEHPVQTNTGNRWHQWTIRVLSGDQDEAISYLAVGQDITDRKQAERRLREREELQELLMRLATGFINVNPGDVDTAINEMLESVGQFTGVDHVQVFRHDHERGISTKTHQWFREDLVSGIEDLETVRLDALMEALHDHAGGEVVHIPSVEGMRESPDLRAALGRRGIRSVVVIPLRGEGPSPGLVSLTSVTEEKRFPDTEIALLEVLAEIIANALSHQQLERDTAEARRRLFTVLDSVDALIYVADMQTHEVLFVNGQIEEAFGPCVGEKCWQAFQVGQDGPCGFCTNDRLVDQDGRPTGTYVWEFRNTLNDRWYECRDRALKWIDGRTVRMEIAVDVTERRKADEEIHLLGSMMASVSDSVVVTDGAGSITYLNRAAEELFGHSLEEVVGRSADTFRARSPTARRRREMDEALDDGRDYLGEFTGRRKDGSSFACEFKIMPLVGDDGETRARVAVYRDITERKDLEDRVRKRTRVERVISRLASGALSSTHDEVDALLDDALGRIGMAMDVDLASNLILDVDGRTRATHRWTRDGAAGMEGFLEAIHIEDEMPWLAARLRRDEFAATPDTGAVSFGSGSEENVIQEHGVRSFLVVPVRHGGRTTGLVAFASGRTRVWDGSDTHVLTMAARTIAQILDHVRIERALVSSEENFRNFFTTVDDMILVGCPAGSIVFANPAVTERLGYDPDELRSMNLLDVHPPGRRDEAERILPALLEAGGGACQLSLVTGEGIVVAAETRFWSGTWNGRACIFSVSKDLTAEQEAHQRFERLFRSSPAPMALSTFPDRVFFDVNDAFLEALGYSRDEILGRTSREMNLLAGAKTAAELDEQLRVAGRVRDQEIQVQRRDGRLLDVLISGEIVTIHGKRHYVTVMIDITDRKRTEEVIARQSDERRILLDNIPTQVWYLTGEHTYGAVNRAYAEFNGLEPEDMAFKDMYEVLAPEDADVCRQHNSEVFRTGLRVVNEVWSPNADGEPRLLVTTKVPKTGADGRIEYVVCSAEDITERREAERAIRTSEEHFRALFMESSVPIMIHDQYSGQIIDANPAALSNHNMSLDDMKSPDIWGEPPYSFSDALTWIRKATREGPQQFEWMGRRAGGVVRWDQVWLSPVTINGVERVMGISIDITDRKRAEDALRESEERLSILLSQTPAVIYSTRIVDGQQIPTYVSRNMEDVLGLSPTHFVDNPALWWEHIHPEDREGIPTAQEDLLRDGRSTLEYRFADRDGEYHWLHDRQRLRVLDDGTQEVIGAWWDITDRREAEERLRYMSFHDSLTGLFNRRYLEEDLARLETRRELPIGVIMVDLNGLKMVNDAYGHGTGDEMLRCAAGILRDASPDNAIIGRWGGDEFVIILPKSSESVARGVCGKVRSLSRDAAVQGVPISMGMGVAVKTRPAQALAGTLKEAEDDMYRQKTTVRQSHRRAVLDALLRALAAKSFETERHVQNMERVAVAIGERIGLHESELARLQLLISLHDIGKITIPDEILAKEGPLTPEEWKVVRRHPATGQRIALATGDFAHVAGDILAHHERWDGSGYPRGIRGKDIPLLARIVAIADAYEVMSNGRPYKRAMSKREVMAEFERCSGTHFDPQLTEVFLEILREGDI